jgi:hypothetical protein
MQEKPMAKACNKGPKIKHPDLEDKVYEWVKEVWMDDIPITTSNVVHIAHVISREQNIPFIHLV